MGHREGSSALDEESPGKGGAEGIVESTRLVIITEVLLERAHALPFGEGEGGKVYLGPRDLTRRNLEEPL